MKKLAIIFPGANYGLDSPLLYYADFIFEANGYERRHKDYEQVNFSEYDKIVFLSKSMGAVKAGEMAVKLGIDVKQIFITPVAEAVEYCDNASCVIIGTKDPAYELYKAHCEKNSIAAMYIEGGDHSLELSDKPLESIEVLKEVMKFVEANI